MRFLFVVQLIACLFLLTSQQVFNQATNITGNKNRARGYNITIDGSENSVTGVNTTVVGNGNNNKKGREVEITGHANLNEGSFVKILGSQNVNNGSNVLVHGTSNQNIGNNNIVKGDSNSVYGSNNILLDQMPADLSTLGISSDLVALFQDAVFKPSYKPKKPIKVPSREVLKSTINLPTKLREKDTNPTVPSLDLNSIYAAIFKTQPDAKTAKIDVQKQQKVINPTNWQGSSVPKTSKQIQTPSLVVPSTQIATPPIVPETPTVPQIPIATPISISPAILPTISATPFDSSLPPVIPTPSIHSDASVPSPPVLPIPLPPVKTPCYIKVSSSANSKPKFLLKVVTNFRITDPDQNSSK